MRERSDPLHYRMMAVIHRAPEMEAAVRWMRFITIDQALRDATNLLFCDVVQMATLCHGAR